LEVSAKDFKVVTWGHASSSNKVQEFEEEVKGKEKEKELEEEPDKEPKKLIIDLSDGESYSNLAGFNYGRPKMANDVGTSGAKELEAPTDQFQPSLDEETKCSPSTLLKLDVVVKT